MRPTVWIVRIAFLAVASVLGVGAVQARQDDGDDFRGASGVTGQRQAIEMELDPEGRPHRFATVVYLQCSGGAELRMTWAPSEFEPEGNRVEVVEPKHEDYGSKGGSGDGIARMVANVTPQGVEGRVRMVWRLQRPDQQEVCDSGNVGFAVGPDAERRVTEMRPSARPWIAYPADSEPAAATSPAQQRFLNALDATCLSWWSMRPQGAPFGEYLRWHEAELDALRKVGRSFAGDRAHAAWIRNVERRVDLERSQLEALDRGDLDAAARLRAAGAALKAQGNDAGLRLGLRGCVSNGPAGAPSY